MDKRLSVIVFLIALALAVAMGRAFQMQVIQGRQYEARSRSNYLRRVPVPAIRGRILDRDGRVIAGWEKTFVAVALFGGQEPGLDPRKARELKRILRRDTLNLEPSYLGYETVAQDIPEDRATAIMERKERFRWLMLFPYFHRTYPDAGLVGHVVGYVDADGNGKAGLEKAMNDDLSGIMGRKYLMVDAKGRVIQEDIYPEEEPEAGADITLTIDLDLQRAADTLFRPYQRGAAVLMNVKTGEVLVMYSKPYVDPEVMVYGTPEEKYQALTAPGSPLLNRAVAGLYPPGSTFKPMIALAGLESGAINENTVFCCNGGVALGNKFFSCTGFHGCLTVVTGIQHSCNSFFYNVALRMGLPKLLVYLNRNDFLTRRYDLGTGGEKRSLIPTLEYYIRRQGRYFTGSALNIAIGQGEVLLTPLHMALVAGLVATGKMPGPHLVLREGDTYYVPRDTLVLPASEHNRELVKLGMMLVGELGTAKNVRIPGFKFGGKTGTAQNPHGANHSVFIFYAPYDNPEICGAVVVENAGYGAVAAAPIARGLIMRYFNLPYTPLFAIGKGETPAPEMPEIEVE